MVEAWVRALVALPFGLVVGSFMTVAVHRLPKGESVVRPRSSCPACGAEIGARDNVPVLSWLLLRGRCRRCGERISVEYPLIELATAGLVVLAAIRYPDPWQAVLVGGLLALMPGVALIDLRHRIIPNRLMYPALLLFAPVIVLAGLIGDAVDPVHAAARIATPASTAPSFDSLIRSPPDIGPSGGPGAAIGRCLLTPRPDATDAEGAPGARRLRRPRRDPPRASVKRNAGA